MSTVAYSNFKVEQANKKRIKLNNLKARVEEFEDMILALDQICESRIIPKLINDEVIVIYEQMLEIDSSQGYIQAGHSNAKIREEELSNEHSERQTSRLCNSDAQIARTKNYLEEALKILRIQHSQARLSSSELQAFTSELEWLHLMVGVISSIGQGHKAYNKQDVLTANAFYKKAQTELMRSNHPDERRNKMIKQMADVLFGRRRALDSELMPEDEFNPTGIQNEQTLSGEEETEQLLSDEERQMVEMGLIAENSKQPQAENHSKN